MVNDVNYLKDGDDISRLNNDAGYVTALDAPVTSVNTKTGDVVLTAADVGALAPGDNVSDLVNDAGYVTDTTAPVTSVSETGDVNLDTKTSDLTNDGEDGSSKYITEAGVNNILDGSGGGTGYLKPGDDVSELVNDAGCLTSADLPAGADLWSKGTDVIYPKAASDDVLVGGVLPSAPNIAVCCGQSDSNHLQPQFFPLQ